MQDAIKDKIAIVGMGCSKFGEIWDKGPEDLIIEAVLEAYQDAGITDPQKQIDAVWTGNQSLIAGAVLTADTLKLYGKPVSRLENMCASGLDAFRNACFGVACGMYDLALVVGFEKLKDMGVSGILPGGGLIGVKGVPVSPPSLFALAGARYFKAFGANREHLARIAVKNHHNGTLSPKAHLQKEITVEQVLNAPMISWPFGLFDCCATSDGAAAAIITRRELAKNFRSDYVLVRGLSMAIAPNPQYAPGFDYLRWLPTELAAKQAYQMAGIGNPAKEIDIAEVHDCFTLTELLTYEDLGFCPKGEAKDYIESGFFTLEGELPVNMDGGLKCFGHPIGASGVRMIYEVYKQLQGKAAARQVKNVEVGLTHSIGGSPQVCGISILHRA